MARTAKVELRTTRDIPELTVHVPRGTSLSDMLRIQADLFEKPQNLPPQIQKLLVRCPACLSGLRIHFDEEYVIQPRLELERLVTNLSHEVRELHARLDTVSRVQPKIAEVGPAGPAGPVVSGDLNF